MPFEADEPGMQNIPDTSGMLPGNEPEMIVVPGFQAGGRIEQTGIALVHEGEYIYPAPGSEARISPDIQGTTGDQVINYYFPVEIVVVGTLSNAEMQRMADFVSDVMTTALESRQIIA
jgi:hypothetical protein